MSAAVGAAISATKDVTFNPQMEEEELMNNKNNKVGGEPSRLPNSDDGHENDHEVDDEPEEEEDAKLKSNKELDLGPQFSLKEQLEKDKVYMIFPFFSFFHFSFLSFNFAWLDEEHFFSLILVFFLMRVLFNCSYFCVF